jgi:hypothetical protein
VPGAVRMDIVEAILDGRQPKGLRLAEMLGNGPLAWDEQRDTWGFCRACAPSQLWSVRAGASDPRVKGSAAPTRARALVHEARGPAQAAGEQAPRFGSAQFLE